MFKQRFNASVICSMLRQEMLYFAIFHLKSTTQIGEG